MLYIIYNMLKWFLEFTKSALVKPLTSNATNAWCAFQHVIVVEIFSPSFSQNFYISRQNGTFKVWLERVLFIATISDNITCSPSKTHRENPGRSFCCHTCQNQPCLNKDGEAAWKNEGSSVKRHETSLVVHPNCTRACHGWNRLRQKPRWQEQESEAGTSQSSKRIRQYLADTDDPSREDSPPPITPPTFRVLFIQDPNWRKIRKVACTGKEVIWTETTISVKRWDELSTNPGSRGFVYRKVPVEGEDVRLDGFVNVYIDEWVSGKLLFLLQHWNRFVVLAMRSRVKWWTLSECWCNEVGAIQGRFDEQVPGGIEKGILLWLRSRIERSSMRFTVSFLIWQYFQSYNLLRDPTYGFDDEYTPDVYMSDVSLLASKVLFWPPVMEHCRAGRKYDLSHLLDHSADSVTRTSRPETRLLKPNHGVPRGWVLKREKSSGSNHVYLPGTKHAPQKVKRDGPYR